MFVAAVVTILSVYFLVLRDEGIMNYGTLNYELMAGCPISLGCHLIQPLLLSHILKSDHVTKDQTDGRTDRRTDGHTHSEILL